VAVLGGLTFKKVMLGGGPSAFGLTPDGVLYSWGSGSLGIDGHGDTTARSSPVAVLGGLTFADFTVNNGSTHVLGLTTAGALYAWGANANGQLGLGDVTARSSPVAVLGGLTFARIGDFGSSHSFAITTTGDLYAWGANTNGELGVGNVTARSSPVAVLGGIKFAQLRSAHVNVGPLAVATDGTLWGWGRNDGGWLGLGDLVDRSSPVAVLGGLTTFLPIPIQDKEIAVTEGTNYTLTISPWGAYFNNIPLGPGISKITIAYDQ
jgi:hypothetical protein